MQRHRKATNRTKHQRHDNRHRRPVLARTSLSVFRVRRGHSFRVFRALRLSGLRGRDEHVVSAIVRLFGAEWGA